jgi:hypothetical protein
MGSTLGFCLKWASTLALALSLATARPLTGNGWVIGDEVFDLDDGTYIVESSGLETPGIKPIEDVMDPRDVDNPLSKLKKRNNYYDVSDRFAQNPRNEKLFKGMSSLKPPLKQNELAGPERIPFTFHMFDCNFASPRFPLEPYMEARDGLLKYCDKWGIPPATRHLAFSKVGDVIVYVCNTDKKKANFCHRNEFRWIEENVFDRRCGQLTSAFVKSAYADGTYGRAWKGERICLDDTTNSASWTGVPDTIARDSPSPDQTGNKWSDWAEWEPYVELDDVHWDALNWTSHNMDRGPKKPSKRPHDDNTPKKDPEYHKDTPKPHRDQPWNYPWDRETPERIRNGTQKGGTNFDESFNSSRPLYPPLPLPGRGPIRDSVSKEQANDMPL